MIRTRLLMVVLFLPIAVGLIGAVLQLSWLPQVPEPAIVHWSATGPDGTGPGWVLPVITLAVAVFIPGIFGLIVVFGLRDARYSVAGKLGLVAPLFGVTVISFVVTAAVGIQRGIASAAQSPDITPYVPVALGLGVIASAAAWFVLPRARRASDGAKPAHPMTLAPGERAAWVGRARLSAVGARSIGVVVVLLTAGAVVVIALSGGLAWPVLAVPLLVALVTIGFLNWNVRIDARGLSVRSILGWPVIRVRPERLRQVGSLTVSPLAYGGWGLRGLPGGTIGVITRAGDGLVVGRVGRGDLVVTVDDAGTAAALLGAMVPPHPRSSRSEL